MPPPPRPDPPAHTMRFTISGLHDSTPWANVFHARNGVATNPSPGDLQQFAAGALASWKSSFIEHVFTTVEVLRCDVLYQESNGDVLGGEAAAPAFGSSSGGLLTAQVSTLISWTVLQRYRGGHPRTYLPPPNDTNLADSVHWTQLHQNAVKAAADNFHGAINSFAQGSIGDVHLGTVSFVHDRAWRTPPVFRDFVIASAICDPRVATQRRRLGPDL